jgi:GNAT superfamily N-acetyltransferase
MSSPIIRPVKNTDLPLLLTATAQTGWDHLTPAEQRQTHPVEVGRRARDLLRQGLAYPHGICLVAEENGLPVAYELLVIREDEVSGLTEALKLDGWVAPAHRGRGLNRVMHQAGEDWCRQIGTPRMVCVVAAHNGASLRATGKCGFETERVTRVKWL